MAVKIVGVCVHGLLGNTFSLGMDSLAAELNRATPDGTHFTIQGGNNPAFVSGALTEQLIDAAKQGAMVIPIGHSLGADFVWDFCLSAQKAGIVIPIAASIDPTDWSTNGAEAGIWIVPPNVQIAMNFRQPYYPGGGYIQKQSTTQATKIQEATYSYPHASFGQSLAMDTAPDIHGAIITAIVQLAKEGHV